MTPTETAAFSPYRAFFASRPIIGARIVEVRRGGCGLGGRPPRAPFWGDREGGGVEGRWRSSPRWRPADCGRGEVAERLKAAVC